MTRLRYTVRLISAVARGGLLLLFIAIIAHSISLAWCQKCGGSVDFIAGRPDIGEWPYYRCQSCGANTIAPTITHDMLRIAAWK